MTGAGPPTIGLVSDWTTRRHALLCIVLLVHIHYCLNVLYVYWCSYLHMRTRVCVGIMCQAGTLLADGWFGCVWALLGDHDYKRECLGTPNVNSTDCCAFCPANNSSSPWFDFRPSAEWLKKIYPPGAAQYACVLFTIVGVTQLSIYGDWMHDRPLGTCKVFPTPSLLLRGCLIYTNMF